MQRLAVAICVTMLLAGGGAATIPSMLATTKSLSTVLPATDPTELRDGCRWGGTPSSCGCYYGIGGYSCSSHSDCGTKWCGSANVCYNTVTGPEPC